MRIGIALNHLKGYRVSGITSKLHKPHGVHKDLPRFIGPIPEVNRLPELETIIDMSDVSP